MQRLVLLVLLVLCGSALFAESIAINVYPALAPNGYGSPSYSGWAANTIYALQNGLAEYGDPNSPSYYRQQSAISGREVLVTSFPSWLGMADPGTVFGPAFAAELGTRAHFPVAILGEGGARFSISEMSFTMDSSDVYDGLDYTYAGGYAYNSQWVGVLYGGDGQLGGLDDQYITSGAATQLVDALFGRGSGNAFWPCVSGDPRPCTTVPERQAALDQDAGYNGEPYAFTGTYTLNRDNQVIASGSGSFTITPTPEPATFVLVGAGIAALLGISRRRRR